MAMTQPSATEVRAVIDLPASLADATIDAFVDDAEALASQCSAVLSSDAAIQKAILKWLTAHMLSGRYGTSGAVTSKSLGDASENYADGQRTFGLGLASTHYGQMALQFDASGCLARLGRQKVDFYVLGYTAPASCED